MVGECPGAPGKLQPPPPLSSPSTTQQSAPNAEGPGEPADTSQVPLPLLGGHLQCSAGKDSGHVGLSSDQLGTLDSREIGGAGRQHQDTVFASPALVPYSQPYSAVNRQHPSV